MSGDTSGALQLATNGTTTAVTIDTSQNVGIGTSSPTGKLHVSAPINTQYGTFDAVTSTYAFTNYKVGGTSYGYLGDASGLVSGGTAGDLAVRFSGAMVFSGGANERMRITSAGYVGIDQTSPTTVFCVGGGMSGGSGNWAHFRNNVGTSANPPASDPYGVYLGCNYSGGNNEGNIVYRGSLTFGAWDGSSYRSHAQFVNAASLGASSGGQLQINRTTNSYQESLSIGTNNTQGIHINETSNSGSINLIYFTRQVSGTQTESGRIYWGGSSIAYLTSSDYRLKKDVLPMTTGLSTVMQLNPVNFVWKHNNKQATGFLAHELQEHCPDAVSGEKDALNEDGSIKVQSVDTSFLVATLTAAIQELKAINDTQAETINTLTARIEVLENKA
jgi:hypothetical protein